MFLTLTKLESPKIRKFVESHKKEKRPAHSGRFSRVMNGIQEVL